MKRVVLLFYAGLFGYCTKKVGKSVSETTLTLPATQIISAKCNYDANSAVSFSLNIGPLILNACGSCHSAPGSGGINLGSYTDIKNLAVNGQMLSVVSNTDVSSTIMPPPPSKHLDSCQIKALTLWINQGCKNN